MPSEQELLFEQLFRQRAVEAMTCQLNQWDLPDGLQTELRDQVLCYRFIEALLGISVGLVKLVADNAGIDPHEILNTLGRPDV